MRSRRTLIALTAVLLASAVAAAVFPEPRPADRAERPRAAPSPPPRAGAGPEPSGDRPAAGDPVRVRFDAGAPAPVLRSVERGAHVVVTVAAPVPGEVTLEGLELVENADRRAPAVFDLLATRRGRFPVLFAPAGEPRRRAGTLVVRG